MQCQSKRISLFVKGWACYSILPYTKEGTIQLVPLNMNIINFTGSLTVVNDRTYECMDGSNPKTDEDKIIAGVVGAASSVTSIQVANLLKLFKIPQVGKMLKVVGKMLYLLA